MDITQQGMHLHAFTSDPAKAHWSTADGERINATHLYLVFDGSTANNRTGVVSVGAGGVLSIALSRVAFDPPNFTQVFVAVNASNTTCVFMDDVPPSTAGASGASTTGVRGLLPPQSPPFPNSSVIVAAYVNATALYGLDGGFPVFDRRGVGRLS